MIFCPFDESAFRKDPLLAAHYHHEYIHYRGLVLFLPLLLRFWSALFSFLAMDKFLTLRRDLVKDLRLGRGALPFSCEPPPEFFKGPEVDAAGLKWDWSCVLEGLALALLGRALPREVGEQYFDSAFGTQSKRYGQNLLHWVSFRYFIDAVKDLTLRGEMDWLVFWHAANVLPVAMGEGLEAVREILEYPLTSGRLDGERTQALETFSHLSLTALRFVSEDKRTLDVIKQRKGRVYSYLCTLFNKNLESIRHLGVSGRGAAIRLSVYILGVLLQRHFQKFLDLTFRIVARRPILSRELDWVLSGTGMYSVPTVFLDGSPAGVYPYSRCFVKWDSSYEAWLSFAFLDRIRDWLLKGSILDCPLFIFQQRFARQGLTMNALRRFCNSAPCLAVRIGVRAEPSAEFCSCRDNFLSLSAIHAKHCPFWMFISRVFDGFRTVGFTD
jgi:hypothetical protein